MHRDEVHVGSFGGDAGHELLEPGAFVEDRVCGGGAANALPSGDYRGPGVDCEVNVDDYVAIGFVVAEEGVVGGVGGQGLEVGCCIYQRDEIDAFWQLDAVCTRVVVPEEVCQHLFPL